MSRKPRTRGVARCRCRRRLDRGVVGFGVTSVRRPSGEPARRRRNARRHIVAHSVAAVPGTRVARGERRRVRRGGRRGRKRRRASVARETVRVAATHVCEIIRAVGPRGLSRHFRRRAPSTVAARRACSAARKRGASPRDSSRRRSARQSKTRLDLTPTLRTIGRAGGAARVTIRAWLNGDRRGGHLSDANVHVEGWVSIDGTVGTFGSEKLHLEAADARLIYNATPRQVDAFSVEAPGWRRPKPWKRLPRRPRRVCEQHELAVSMNLLTMPLKIRDTSTSAT